LIIVTEAGIYIRIVSFSLKTYPLNRHYSSIFADGLLLAVNPDLETLKFEVGKF